MAIPGSILERTSSGETTLYFHMNFHLFYLFGLHVKIYAVILHATASKVLTQDMNLPRIKLIPFCFEAAAWSASLPGMVKVIFYCAPFSCASGQRISFGKKEATRCIVHA
jgi:hypothetical protein